MTNPNSAAQPVAAETLIERLLPCPNPWCHDSKPDWALVGDMAVVRCLSCGLCGPQAVNVTFAKTAWNTRSDPEITRLQAEVARLTEALKDGKQSLAVAIYGLPEMLERNALSDEEGMVAALQAAVDRMDAALSPGGE